MNHQNQNYNQNQSYSLNASLASMDPSTFQNSPYVSSGYQMGSSQGYSSGMNISNQQQTANFVPNRSQFTGQPQQGMVNASLASMSPDTYYNSPYSMQNQSSGQSYARSQHMNYTPNFSEALGSQQNKLNASLATMGPDTYLNSPYRQNGFQMGQTNQQNQYQPQQYMNNTPSFSEALGPNQYNLNASLATMSPDSYLNSPYRQNGYQMSSQYPQNGVNMQNNYENMPLSSLATQDPTTYNNLQNFQQS